MKIALCIPVHNEEAGILSLLQNFKESFIKAAVDYEILLFLDSCSDNTLSLVDVYLKEDKNVSYFQSSKRSGKLFGLNFLAEIVKSKVDINYVIIADSDILFSPDLIERCMQIDNFSLVVPRIVVAEKEEKNIFYYWSRLSCEIYDQLRQAAARSNSLWFISGNFLFFEISCFLSLFPVDKNFLINDDAYLGWKILAAKRKLKYDSDIVISSRFPRNLREFVRQKIRVRKGFAQLLKLNMPVAELRKELNYSALKLIFQSRQYSLLLLLILDNMLFALAKLILVFKNEDPIWKRIN